MALSPEAPATKDPTELLMEFQTQFANMAAGLRGAVSQLEGQGFTSEQAHQIVADIMHLAAKAGSPEGLEE